MGRCSPKGIGFDVGSNIFRSIGPIRCNLKVWKKAINETEQRENALLLREKQDNFLERILQWAYESLPPSGVHLDRSHGVWFSLPRFKPCNMMWGRLEAGGCCFFFWLFAVLYFDSPQKMNLRQSLKMAKAMSASRRIMPSIWARSMNFSLGLRRVATS